MSETSKSAPREGVEPVVGVDWSRWLPPKKLDGSVSPVVGRIVGVRCDGVGNAVVLRMSEVCGDGDDAMCEVLASATATYTVGQRYRANAGSSLARCILIAEPGCAPTPPEVLYGTSPATGRPVEGFTQEDVGREFEVVADREDVEESHGLSVGTRVRMVGPAERVSGYGQPDPAWRRFEVVTGPDTGEWRNLEPADVRHIGAASPVPAGRVPPTVEPTVGQVVRCKRYRCTHTLTEHDSINDVWRTDDGCHLTRQFLADETEFVRGPEAQQPTPKPTPTSPPRGPYRLKTYAELMRVEREADGLPGEVLLPTCRRCLKRAPIGRDMVCSGCYATLDKEAARMTAAAQYKFRPYEPAPEPWTPSCDPEFWIPGVNEHGGT